MKSTFRPAFLLMCGRVVGFAVAFAVPLVLVRLFDQAEFGTYKQVFLIYTTLYGIAQLGMAESLFYFLPISRSGAGKNVFTSLLVLAGSGVLCLGALQAGSTKIAGWLSNPEMAKYLGLLGLFLLLTLIGTPLEIVLTARNKYLEASVCYALSEVLRTAFFLLPLLLYRNLFGLLLGAVAFGVVRVGAAAVCCLREFPGELRIDASALRRHLAYALPFALAVLVDSLQANLPHYAVAHRFDAATFAIYSVGCLQIPLIDFVYASVGNVMMVRMGEELRDGRKAAASALWHDTTRKLAIMFFPVLGLVLLAARDLITLLFTHNYVRSAPIFMLWSLPVMFSALQTDAVLRVYADTKMLLMLNTVKLLAIGALIGWSLSAFGITGAVLVAIAATALVKGLSLLRIRRLMGLPLSELLPWRHLGALLATSAAATIPALIVMWRVTLPTLASLAVTGILYTVTFIGLAVWSNAGGARELLSLENLLPRRKAAVIPEQELETSWR